MKFYLKILFSSIFIFLSIAGSGQKKRQITAPPDTPQVDSMFVNLYTDSLKKGTYNYINIVGKLRNGRYLPLDTSLITLVSSDGKFFGNSLWLDQDFNKEKVSIKVVLKSDPAQNKEFSIYIKKAPDPVLKSEEQILDEMKQDGRRGRHP